MPPPIVTATLQTALIGAFSNVLAQAITAHQSNVTNPFPHTNFIPLKLNPLN